MTQVTSTPRETDRSARKPVGLLLAAALLWLVAASVLSLVTAIQLHTPSFMAGCPAFTYGRAQALQETAFIYGWGANAAFAVAIWILARLGGAPLRGVGLLTLGACFWNLGLLIGLICISTGELTGIPFLQMPAYVHPLLLVSYAAIATSGVLAWTGRRAKSTFAAQWYAVAALFLFPWFYSVAQFFLLAAPMRGVAQAVVAAWFGESVVSLCLIPVALAATYYLVPKITGRTLLNYNYALHGFWTLIFFASWTGARHLVGGPVPVWISSTAIVCTTLVLFHYLIVALNLRAGFRSGQGSSVLGFVSGGLLAYSIGGVAAAVFAFQGFAEIVQFTFFQFAQAKLLLMGAFSLPIFGAIYFLVPQIAGVEWPSRALIRAHYGVTLLGLVLAVVSLAAAGWMQGQGLRQPATSFAAIAATTKPWLLVATAGEALLLLGSLVLTVHFFRVQFAAAAIPEIARAPDAVEASVS